MNEGVLMYLRRLSQPAKEVFIDIAKYLCNADGIVDKREEKLLAAYGEELQMTISLDCDPHEKNPLEP